jgi:murein DD-endopeptidase MepM/ murein hydrolase activator NlpD
MALIALVAAFLLWIPAAWAQTVELPPSDAPPPATVEPIPTVDPPPPPDPDPTDGRTGSSTSKDPSDDPTQADRDDPLRRWRDWTPTPGAYDTSHLDRFAARMRERGWGEGRIRRQVYAPFIVMGPATWSDSWGALRLVAGPRSHTGQDVLCTYGAPVLATEPGTVTWSTNTLGGLAAYLHRPDGSFYYYAHLSATPDGLAQGSRVDVGDVIGSCGATGNASVPHVHFSYVTADGTSVDPMGRLVGWLETAERRLPNPPERRPEPAEERVVAPETLAGAPRDEVPTSSSLPPIPEPPEQLSTAAAARQALESPVTVPAATLLLGVPLLGFWRRRTREPIS